MTRLELIECMAVAAKNRPRGVASSILDGKRLDMTAAFDAITAAGMVIVPRETLHDLYMDQLENAFNAGLVRPDGVWWSGGMSDAEWLERICKMPSPINAEALQERLPHIASAMTEAANG